MRSRPVLFALSLAGAAGGAAGAQEQTEAAPDQTRMVVPGPHYRAGALHRFVFGEHYRPLWTAPLPAEVLDLRSFSGGLTPRRKGGGRQTRALK
ncbi:MAG TPA: hypothetical protein VFO85_16565, partial [Vicinamibacteria bacterium]|nr:hypothetical protein [Vicinamibacteria bacterium]